MKIGTRVRLDNYPAIDEVPIGSLGTVIGLAALGFVKVKMDDDEYNVASPGDFALFYESELEVIDEAA